jgi:hypothetical protein
MKYPDKNWLLEVVQSYQWDSNDADKEAFEIVDLIIEHFNSLNDPAN